MIITRIQVQNYRGLKNIDQELGPFQALVGPNASGKTTFLDVFAMLGELMRGKDDISEIMVRRSSNFSDLIWKGEETSIRVGIEFSFQETSNARDNIEVPNHQFKHELEIRFYSDLNSIILERERSYKFFLNNTVNPPKIFQSKKTRELFCERDQFSGLVDYEFFPGVKLTIKGTDLPLQADKTAAQQTVLGTIFSSLQQQGTPQFKSNPWNISSIVLDSHALRRPSPPGLGKSFRPDGSNLPWIVEELRKDKPTFDRWLAHVRTALGDIRDIRVIDRPEDRHRYLVVDYDNGASVPSWLVSDGTLRLLALTILAYIKDLQGIFLIEEPENGIHPQAMETVTQSLSSVYGGQVLMATHSPVVIDQLEPSQMICFGRDEEGAVTTVSGDQHPALRDWKRGTLPLGMLMASGILS